jgi:hypothetical protein
MNSLALVLYLAVATVNNLVQPLGGAPQILIPVAGNVPGLNATHFRSDIAVINLRNVTQRVRFDWLPQSGGATRSPLTIDIAPSSAIRVEDFVGEVLQMNGLGSIIVTGMTSADTADLNAVLYVTSRIWTPQPATGGTTSQSLSTVPVSAINTPAASIFGLRRDARYRVNVGIVNLDATRTQTFQVWDPVMADPPVVHVVTIPPMSMQQAALASVTDDAAQILVGNVTDPATRSNRWITYGASIDNTTGDSWSELGVAGTVAP